MADNYTQLQADIVDYIASNDLNPAAFIRQAEQYMNRELRLQAMLSKSTITPALTGDRYIGTLPSDFMEAFHVEQGGLRLDYRTPNRYWHEHASIYTLMGTDIHVTAATDIDLWYYGKEDALSASNQTNAFTSKCYDGLFLLACSYAFFYMNDFERSDSVGGKGLALIAAAQEADDRARHSGGPIVQRA